jgi:hypothetical protein
MATFKANVTKQMPCGDNLISIYGDVVKPPNLHWQVSPLVVCCLLSVSATMTKQCERERLEITVYSSVCLTHASESYCNRTLRYKNERKQILTQSKLSQDFLWFAFLLLTAITFRRPWLIFNDSNMHLECSICFSQQLQDLHRWCVGHKICVWFPLQILFIPSLSVTHTGRHAHRTSYKVDTIGFWRWCITQRYWAFGLCPVIEVSSF